MDTSIEQMATMYPVTMDELQKIQGVGRGKVLRYGEPFIKQIKLYCEENDIVRPEDIRVKSIANKSVGKVKIIGCIDRKIPLDEIAQSLHLKFSDLLDELEAIVYSGTRVDLRYYVEQAMDEEQFDDIYAYFEEAETDSLTEAYEELAEDYSEEDIRLIRLLYVSENAN